MPYPPRYSDASPVHHVMARGVDHQHLFHDDADRDRYLGIARDARLATGAALIGLALLVASALIATRLYQHRELG
ncbi:MAG: hypothetical protein LBR33_01570 [Propionibacteriaceae bacterium]|jgi:hypothetical protein|nr:hypothetical protein [Propionibacteriaceae bacterium]